MTYQNILNNNVRSIDCKLLEDEYFDYMLYKGEVYGSDNIPEMTIADFSCPFLIESGVLYSTSTWVDAKNNGVLLEDIGFTGPDNGFISFRKDRISNKDYLDILTGSTYEIEEDDTRLFLSPITGNTLNFDYPMFLDEDETGCFLALQGGFYQGFYKLFGKEWCYQTLPNGPDYEWNLYFDIRPRSDYEVGVTTVNHIHPENKGIFFYLGTRAENKFWSLYKTDEEVTNPLKRIPDDDNYTNAEICGEESDTDFNKNNVIREDYMADEPEEIPESYFEDDYTISASTDDCPCAAQHLAEEQNKHENYYFDDGYLAEDDDYVTPMGEKDCKGHRAPGGDLRPYCAANSSAYGQKSTTCKGGGGYCDDDVTFTISDIYEYKYQEDSDCCEGGSNCKTSSCSPSKGSCCCGTSDYKEPCECDNFFQDDFYNDECYNGPKAIEDEYLGQDADINENEIQDSFGHELTKKGYYEIESDNKFLMFDRTKDGFTVNNWIEGTKVTLTARQDWANINYFPIMNRTCTGYTVDNIYKYQEENSIPYNIYKDIKNNAFCLRITDDGAIGYKYSVLDCEAENDQHYTVREEYSNPGVVKIDEWNKIVVKIAILNPIVSNGKYTNKGHRKMKLYFYVNGFLVFISKELDEFNFRELNDTYQKQEGVPYSISLGGGTQGLLESILPDYYNTPDYIFPIEKDFCGTFLGDIKSFKIIDGSINFFTIKQL